MCSNKQSQKELVIDEQGWISRQLFRKAV